MILYVEFTDAVVFPSIKFTHNSVIILLLPKFNSFLAVLIQYKRAEVTHQVNFFRLGVIGPLMTWQLPLFPGNPNLKLLEVGPSLALPANTLMH